jgi:phytoene dehydrogenase-like protein
VRRLAVSLRHAHQVYGGPRRYFHVFIHDTVDEMRQAAKAYNGEAVDDALAVCQPAPVREQLADDGETWEQVEPPHFGGILDSSAVTTEIVADTKDISPIDIALDALHDI